MYLIDGFEFPHDDVHSADFQQTVTGRYQAAVRDKNGNTHVLQQAPGGYRVVQPNPGYAATILNSNVNTVDSIKGLLQACDAMELTHLRLHITWLLNEMLVSDQSEQVQLSSWINDQQNRYSKL